MNVQEFKGSRVQGLIGQRSEVKGQTVVDSFSEMIGEILQEVAI